MAGNTGFMAFLGNFEQHHVVVAVDAHLVHGLHVARLFTLEPQLVARAAEIHRTAQLGGFLQGFAVHPRKHHHITAAAFLRNHGHQALRIPFDLIEPAHWNSCFVELPAQASSQFEIQNIGKAA